MALRTRFGFFGVTEEEANRAKPTTRNSTNLALASPFGVQDIEVDLTSFFAEDNGTNPVIRSFVYIDPQYLTFTQVDGRHQASFELHGAIFGDNGAIVEQLARGATLNLSDADYEYAMRQGLGMNFDMPVKRPGAYQMRVVARDVVLFRDGKIVYTGPEVPIAGQADLNRMSVGGGLRLGPELEPGYYYLQVVITDKDAKQKTASVAQWADFQIEK